MESRVACPDRVTHFLENAWDVLEVQNKVHRPQLPVLTYEHLGFEDSIEVVDVDQTKARHYVPFILKNSRGANNG